MREAFVALIVFGIAGFLLGWAHLSKEEKTQAASYLCIFGVGLVLVGLTCVAGAGGFPWTTGAKP